MLDQMQCWQWKERVTKRRTFDLGELSEMLTYPGLWKLARGIWREGPGGNASFLEQESFCRSLQQLIPEVTDKDWFPQKRESVLKRCNRTVTLVNDFLLVAGEDRNPCLQCSFPSGDRFPRNRKSNRRPDS